MANDDELRERAQELLKRRAEPQVVEEGPDSLPAKPLPKGRRASAGELARAAAAPGAGLLAVVTLLTQLLTERASPATVKALSERVEALETERTARRVTEFSRDVIENCRSKQADGYLQMMLPRKDSQIGYVVRPWFDECPPLPEPTTGAKPAPK